MPKWKGRCIRFEPPLNYGKLEVCAPSPSTFQSVLSVLISPFRNFYFWIWLIYSLSSNDFERLDNIRIPRPFSEIYSFLVGSTELAAAVRSQIDSIIIGNPVLSWVFLFFGPEVLPASFHNLFESLQYYDDWIEAYKLGRLLLPELWELVKGLPYICLQLVNLIPKAIFIVVLILPFTSFNFFLVASLSPLLADSFHREFERNFKVWETHLIEPLICCSTTSVIKTTAKMAVPGKIVNAGVYTYQERKPNWGIPWAFFIWSFIAIFSALMLMLAVLFAWDISFFALPWCFFSVSYFFRGSHKRRAAPYGRASLSSSSINQASADMDLAWAVGWKEGHKAGQLAYHDQLVELIEPQEGNYDEEGNYYEDDQGENGEDDQIGNDQDDRNGDYAGNEDEGEWGYEPDYPHEHVGRGTRYRGQRYTGERKPVIPNPQPPKGSTITDEALGRKDRALWYNDRTGE
ncbi:hypothetical protein TWF281_009201 [Arthrobotrys megalospora]